MGIAPYDLLLLKTRNRHKDRFRVSDKRPVILSKAKDLFSDSSGFALRMTFFFILVERKDDAV